MSLELIQVPEAPATPPSPPAEVPPEAATEKPAEAAGATGAEPPKPEPPKDTDSRRFAAIARREREARALEMRAREAHRQAEEDRREREAFRAELAQMKSDPLGFLQKHGNLSYEDLTRRYVLREPEKPVEPAKVDPELAALKAELAELKAAKEAEKSEAQKAAEAKAAQSQAAELRSFLESRLEVAKKTPEKYEMVLADPDRAVPVFLDLFGKVWRVKNDLDPNATAEDIQRAAAAGYEFAELDEDELTLIQDRVEAHLTELEEQRINKLAQSKRFAARFAKASEQPKSPEVPTPPAKPAEPKTLTNDLPRSTPMQVSSNTAGKTREQIEREALERVARKFPRA